MKINLIYLNKNNQSKISNYSVVQSDVNFADNIITIGFEHVIDQSTNLVLIVLCKRAL